MSWSYLFWSCTMLHCRNTFPFQLINNIKKTQLPSMLVKHCLSKNFLKLKCSPLFQNFKTWILNPWGITKYFLIVIAIIIVLTTLQKTLKNLEEISYHSFPLNVFPSSESNCSNGLFILCGKSRGSLRFLRWFVCTVYFLKSCRIHMEYT